MRLLTKLYILIFNLRSKFFGFNISYPYWPKSFSKIAIPVDMDIFWLKYLFLGRNICYVPDGKLVSDRFNEKSPYYESWIGTYFIFDLKKRKFNTIEDSARFFANAAIADQDSWLRTYGINDAKTRFINKSLKHLKSKQIGKFTQDIFYGEIVTKNDDYSKHKSSILFRNFPTKYIRMAAEEYNKIQIPKGYFSSDYSNKHEYSVHLFGFYSIIKLSNRKYAVTYACGEMRNKDEIYNELFKVVENIKPYPLP